MDRKLPSALPTPEEWRLYVRTGLADAAGMMSRRSFWGLLGSSVFLTTLAGPFGTFEELDFPLRLAYWAVGIVFVTILVTTLSFIAYRTTQALGWPWLPGALVAALLAIPPHWLLVYEMDNILLPGSNDGMLGLLPYIALPVLVMTIVVNAIVIRMMSMREALEAPPRAEAPAEGATAEVVALPAEASLLFQRVPAHLGRDVVCLRAQDHYLEVVTTAGSALVLMRLSDAERDLAALRGMRVHRSWWVALDHVAEFSHAEGGGINLKTTTGHTIPVARAQRAALRAALQPAEDRAAE